MVRNSQIFQVTRRLSRPRVRLLIAATLVAFAGGVAVTAPPVIIGKIIDLIEVKGDVTRISLLIAAILAALVMAQLLKHLQRYIVETVCTAAWRDEMVNIASKLLKAPAQEVSLLHSGNVAIIASAGAKARVKLVKLSFVEIFPQISLAFIAIYFAFTAHASMIVILPAIILLGGSVTIWQIVSQAGIRDRLERSRANMGGDLSRLVQGIFYVQASGLAPRALQNIEKSSDAMRDDELTHHKAMMNFDLAKYVIEGLGYVVLLTYSAWLSYQGFISTGEVVMLLMLFNKAMAPIQHLHRIVDELQSFSVQSSHVSELTSIPSRDVSARTVSPNDAGDHIISCDNFGLSIEVGNEPVLSDLNIKISKGDWVGVTGSSGSGKSTFFKACLGIYGAHQGQLEIGGHDVSTLDPEGLTQFTAYCPQDAFVFPGTVRENITCMADIRGECPTDDDIWDVLDCVGLRSKVEAMGLDGELAEFGTNLSGGQGQLLMLARTILCNAEIYFFDECTSALDPATERALMVRISERLANKTCLFISHKPLPLQFADYTLEFDSGQVSLKAGPKKSIAESLVSIIA